MNNVITLHGEKRWKAIIEYRIDNGLKSVEHYFEEISELHLIIEHGPDWEFFDPLHGYIESSRRWRRAKQCRESASTGAAVMTGARGGGGPAVWSGARSQNRIQVLDRPSDRHGPSWFRNRSRRR
ncbi:MULTISPECIES: hypothetical protein [unclassified Mesorhizobium]|uniref:hypothetical protein n=1 Tax=unclassified Mesorhizobium TaxID=325217 RepID=UPI002415A7B6|nr:MULTISPECIES: hypothetical protein [unclassified Mesorhizobium]MDG4903510.1 hypothetical protein [Mesorhizobium sp. WSM4962]MDG4921440.1 hypothetical protein [Mesorhizobium sp. WSM4989]